MQDTPVPVVSIPGGEIGQVFTSSFQWLWHILPGVQSGTFTTVKTIVAWLVVISIPLSLFFLIGIIYCVEQLKVIKKKYAEKHDVKVEPAFEDVQSQGNRDLTTRWRTALDLLNSQNQNDWKQAIIQMDTMLLDILTGLGYQGDGVGEKLKRIQPGEMKSIDDAWEAHKMRNTIAHEAGFQLDHHAATQTMHRFRKVFEEFYYI